MDYFTPFHGDSLAVLIWNEMSFGILIYSEMRNFYLKLLSNSRYFFKLD